VRRGDKVVFGFPNGDTVLAKCPGEDYHALCREFGKEQTDDFFGPVIARPSDKKDHYVKRCVAVAGDTLEVREGLVWVNGVRQEVYPGVQLSYKVVTKGQKINSRVLDDLGLNIGELYFDPTLPGYPAMPLTAEMFEKVAELGMVVSVTPNLETAENAEPATRRFPYVETGWTRDFYGPVWIPQKGVTVSLTAENLPLYERIITAYEHHSLEVAQGRILIDGQAAQDYTFAQDYYFMMGDNRHNSLDSRYWGFVPEDHVVGRPVVIWLSTDQNRSFPKSVRWSRFFKFV